jgi:DNA-binding response OmpR family regulator
LLDLQMPGMSGFDVMHDLHALEPEDYLPVFALTGEPSFKLQALKAGAKDFIAKPYDAEEVLTRITICSKSACCTSKPAMRPIRSKSWRCMTR